MTRFHQKTPIGELTTDQLREEIRAREEKVEPYWKDWREVSVAPLYATEDDVAKADITNWKSVFAICGGPGTVLAYSIRHAFEQARLKWPSATGWAVLGLIDPEDPECTIEGGPRGIQRVVTEVVEE